MKKNINSHLTAKERDKVSFPTSQLINMKLLNGKILDFGCGHGFDTEYLKNNGFDVIGYDPYYFPELPSEKFDTIICNYVINVLLPEEQSNVLMKIAELLKPSGKAYFSVRRDLKRNGYVYNTKHNCYTYQQNIKLPFRSILLNDFCEIYEYRHYNQIEKEDIDKDCPFCNPPKDRVLLTELVNSYSILDGFPVSKGHTLILPKKHISSYFDLDIKTQRSIWIMVNETKEILKKMYNPDGFNVGINIGEYAGQTIFHAHIHLIPRYKGDVENPRGGIRHVIPSKGYYL